MNAQQKDAFAKLMDVRPDLTYEQINELRRLVKNANALESRIHSEDEFIRETMMDADVIFETADGLKCMSRVGRKIAWSREGRPAPEIKLPVVAPTFSVPIEADCRLSNPQRIYAFHSFIGGPGNRRLLYREVQR